MPPSLFTSSDFQNASAPGCSSHFERLVAAERIPQLMHAHHQNRALTLNFPSPAIPLFLASRVDKQSGKVTYVRLDDNGIPLPHFAGGMNYGMGMTPTGMGMEVAPTGSFCPPSAGTVAIVGDKVKVDKWSEYTNVDGNKFYHSPAKPNETTWDKPQEFVTEENASNSAAPTKPKKKKPKYHT